MSSRYIPIAVILSAILSGVLLWRWLAPADETAARTILRVAVSRSARWIAVGSASGWIGIIDQTLPDGQQRFRGSVGKLRDLRFSKDEHWLIVTNDAAARHAVQSLGSLEPLGPGDDPGEPQMDSVATNLGERTSNVVSASDGTAVFGNFAGSVEVHDAHNGKMLRRFTFR